MPGARGLSWVPCPPFARLVTLCTVCNRARFEEGEMEKPVADRKALGDAPFIAV